MLPASALAAGTDSSSNHLPVMSQCHSFEAKPGFAPSTRTSRTRFIVSPCVLAKPLMVIRCLRMSWRIAEPGRARLLSCSCTSIFTSRTPEGLLQDLHPHQGEPSERC